MQNLLILYEDNHIIAVNKKPSQLVQGDKTGDITLIDIIKEYLKKKYNKPGNIFLGLVHRLDRPASGVILFAKTSKALTRLNNMFKEKEIKKKYWAIVKNKPDAKSDTLIHYLVKNQEKNRSYAYDNEKLKTKKAILKYNVLKSTKTYYLLEVNLLTGRHHQIRCQLAKIDCPIKGDLKYGFPRSNKNASIHLHARNLEFIHPVQNTKIKIEANPPDDVIWNEIMK